MQFILKIFMFIQMPKGWIFQHHYIQNALLFLRCLPSRFQSQNKVKNDWMLETRAREMWMIDMHRNTGILALVLLSKLSFQPEAHLGLEKKVGELLSQSKTPQFTDKMSHVFCMLQYTAFKMQQYTQNRSGIQLLICIEISNQSNFLPVSYCLLLCSDFS